jgi:hypothetical protein
MRKTLALILVSITLVSLLAGCGPKTNPDPSAAAVESYMNALVNKDAAKASTLACKEWESQAQLEVDSFQSVSASLENMTCKKHGTDGNFTLINCTGKIIATYNNEKQALDLSSRIYRTIEEQGGWRVCGYQ